MTLEETVNKFLRDTVNLITGKTNTIRSRQDGPRPKGSYADIGTISDISLHWEQSTLADRQDNDLDQTIEGQRELMYSIGFYRTGSMDLAKSTHIGLIRNSIQELFKAANIGLIRRSEIRDISEALENGWEERSQFDIFLNMVGTDADIICSILSVDISAEFQSGTETYNTNIIIQ